MRKKILFLIIFGLFGWSFAGQGLQIGIQQIQSVTPFKMSPVSYSSLFQTQCFSILGFGTKEGNQEEIFPISIICSKS